MQNSISRDNTKDRSKPSYEELMYMYESLDHESKGLKLQLASKQEVLERSIAQLDLALSELDQAKITITSQENIIRDLTTKLQMYLKKSLENRPEGIRNMEHANLDKVKSGAKRPTIEDTFSCAHFSGREESPKGGWILSPSWEEGVVKPMEMSENGLLIGTQRSTSVQTFRAALSPLPSPRPPNPPEFAPACKITMAARVAKLRDHDN